MYVTLFVFATGQLLALPSVAAISGRLGGTGAFAPCQQLTRAQVGWGIVCGLSVSSGYPRLLLGLPCRPYDRPTPITRHLGRPICWTVM